MKIRVLSPLNALAVSAHGGSPLPIPFNELYTALRIGLADGADLTMWITDALRFYEVQKYMFLDRRQLPLGVMIINEQFYQQLEPDLQDIVRAAAHKAIAFNRKMASSLESELIERLRQHGMRITIPTPDERERLAGPSLSASVGYLEEVMSDRSLITDVLAATRSGK
jgi:TRAP-type C4-dicarboxylate transport system substrate-binding protein